MKIRDGLIRYKTSKHPADQNQASYLFVRAEVWPELSLSIQSEVCVVIVLQSLSHCSKQAVFVSASSSLHVVLFSFSFMSGLVARKNDHSEKPH